MSSIRKFQLTETDLNIYETRENLNSCMSRIIGWYLCFEENGLKNCSNKRRLYFYFMYMNVLPVYVPVHQVYA